MENDENDDIAEWAKNLTPEGGPGEMPKRMRELLGDQGYEKAVAQQDASAERYLERQNLINSILTMFLSFGTLFGVVGLFAAIAGLILLVQNILN